MKKAFWIMTFSVIAGFGGTVGWYTGTVLMKWVIDRLLTPLVDMAHAETMNLMANRFMPANFPEALLVVVQVAAGGVIAGAALFVLADILFPAGKLAWRKAAEN